MATTRPFAYNPSQSPIDGTEQLGDLAIGQSSQDYSVDPGGVDFWMGPDEDLGYVITIPVPSGDQPTQIPEDAITLSSTYKGGDITLSNNNQTATQIFGYQQSVLGETIISGTNQVMFSVLCNLLAPSVLVDSHFVGVGTTSMNYQGNPYGGYPGNDTQSIGFNAIGQYYYNGSVVASGLPTWTDGDTIDIAISHGQYWWIRVNGGNWNNNPSANPTTLTGGLTMNGLTNYYPVLCPAYQGIMTVLNYPKYGVPSDYNFLGNVTASVGFYRSEFLTENSFLELTNNQFNQNFVDGNSAVTWLNSQGYWTSYVSVAVTPTVTPTPTVTQTQTTTSTNTPTPTITPTQTTTSTNTPTPTITQTPTITPSVTSTITLTPSITPTNTPNLQGFNYTNFASTAGLTFVGAAAVSGGTIIALTTTTSASVGNMYRTTAIQYNRNFSTTWSTFIGGGTGADGYCVQWTPTNNTNGPSGSGVGLLNTAINAITFLTFTANDYTWYKNGVSQGATSVSSGFWRQALYFWGDYNHSAQTFALYYNTTNSKPGSPNQTFNSFSFDTGSYYMGFGAGTGGSNDNQEILSWNLQFT
jgi:hypothetical protein